LKESSDGENLRSDSSCGAAEEKARRPKAVFIWEHKGETGKRNEVNDRVDGKIRLWR